MRDSYFDAYRSAMNPFFKDPNGKICEYDEMKDRGIYRVPYYTEEEEHQVDVEARKYMFCSNTDYQQVRKMSQGMKRGLVKVGLYLK